MRLTHVKGDPNHQCINRPIFYRFPIVKSTFKQKCVKFCIIFLLGRCMTLNKFIYVYITVQLGLQEAQWPNVHLKFVNYILFDFSWKYCKKVRIFFIIVVNFGDFYFFKHSNFTYYTLSSSIIDLNRYYWPKVSRKSWFCSFQLLILEKPIWWPHENLSFSEF